jgi:hypothetical protein
MINYKVKILSDEYVFRLEKEINDWLKTVDARQIIKSDYTSSSNPLTNNITFSAIFYYVEYADIRDLKIDNILEIK